MAITKINRQKWSILLLILAVVGAVSWYAHSRGWFLATSAWVRHAVFGKAISEPEQDDMSGMNMPGMNMSGMSETGPKEASEVPGHVAVTIPAGIQRRIGVILGSVEKGPLEMTVQTVGIIQPDETKIARIHLRTDGWIQNLFINFTGQLVRKGDPLLEIYSPAFLSTQQEYLTARRAERSASGVSKQQSLSRSARRRLELLGVPEQVIEKLEESGEPEENITLPSPITGTVLEKHVQAKDYVTAEKELYVIADLSTIWVQAKVYEYELPHVELGQPAVVTIPALQNLELTGKVVFIQPTVEEATRTVQVRVELPNDDGLLKPGMFAHVTIAHQMGEGLLVPASAIIRTGERDLAYRVESPDKFVPVDVTISELKFGDRIHVLEGLKPGEKIVTSANFLIDSESRLREGSGGMPGMAGMDMGDMEMDGMKGMDQPKQGDMEGMDHSKMK